MALITNIKHNGLNLKNCYVKVTQIRTQCVRELCTISFDVYADKDAAIAQKEPIFSSAQTFAFKKNEEINGSIYSWAYSLIKKLDLFETINNDY